MIGFSIAADLMGIVVCTIIMSGSIQGNSPRSHRDGVFLTMVSINLLTLVTDLFTWLAYGRAELNPLIWGLCLCLLILGYSTVLLFAEYIRQYLLERGAVNRHSFRILGGMMLAGLAVILGLSIQGSLFSVVDGVYVDGPSITVYYLMLLLASLTMVYVLFRHRQLLGQHIIVVGLFYLLLSLAASLVNLAFLGLSLTYAAQSLAVLLIYVLFHRDGNPHPIADDNMPFAGQNQDPLTGVFNRRAYTVLLDSITPDRNIGVVFLDVNGLKYINDSQGHEAGDQLLKKAAALMLMEFRRNDVFRISGDEFVILMPGIPAAAFETRVNRFRRSLTELEYPIVAMGSAFGSGSQLHDLVSQAEDRMYADKAAFHRNNPEFSRRGSLFLRSSLNTNPYLAGENVSRKMSTVMVVEDNDLNREMISELLAEEYQVVEMPDGKQALNYLRDNPGAVRLILLDLVMPEMDGFEFLAHRAKDPVLSCIPVLVDSSSGEEAEQRARELGATDFLSKPFNPEIMLNRVSYHIQQTALQNSPINARYDELTGLYSRQAFYQLARELLANNPGRQYSLVLSDIQNFKMVNRSYGEPVGDELLKYYSHIMLQLYPENTLIGRYGGDQFVFLVEDSSITEEQLKQYLEAEDRNPPVSNIILQFGVYNSIPHDVPISQLCDCAQMALRSIKHQYGRMAGFYDEEMQRRFLMQQQMERDMLQAYEQEQFRVYYQPKHDAVTGQLIGAEALVRWVHPEFGFIPPDAFIALFERNGFISRVDYYVWRRTCQNQRRWLDQGLSIVPISVNSSKMDFRVENHLDIVRKPLADAQLDPSWMHIEITESVFSEDVDKLIVSLQNCREAGFHIELDDFGAGYSSLNTLGILPVDTVKFDRLFMQELNNERRAKVLSSFIRLCKTLGLHTISEGVETPEQVARLKEMGCDAIQGYVYSPPLSEHDFEEYLKKYAEKPI